MGADLGFEVLGLGLVAPQPGLGAVLVDARVRELLAAGEVEGGGRGARAAARAAGPARCRASCHVDERMCLPAEGLYSGTVTEGDRIR